MRFGEIVQAAGKVTAEQIEALLARQATARPRRRLGEMLIAEGLLTEREVLEVLGTQFAMPVAPAIDPEWLDPELVRDVPVEWARSRRVLPLRRGGEFWAALCDPTDVAARDDLALLLGGEARPLLVPEEALRASIARCYFQRRDRASDLEGETLEGPAAEGPAGTEADDLLSAHRTAPVARLVNMILLEALRQRASDVHLEPLEDRLRVRYRIDGLLYEQSSPPRRYEEALVSRLKVMGHLDIAEKRLPQDGTARVRIGDQSFDVRISTIPVAEGERVVLRLLQREAALLPLGALGMSDTVAAAFRDAIRESAGAVWVTGPTGSGKTTTLYAALQELDTEHRNILTIEDPVEYQLPHIGQMAVKPRIGLTFARGLRHILRQDPDVILVGETRDLETAEIAIRASLTGHLVLSTLHTNDACGALLRLTDMGVAPYLVCAATRGVLAQRLVRMLCGKCRLPVAGGGPPFEARGCEACLGGYQGRLGVYEYLPMSAALQEALRSGRSLAEMHGVAARQGLHSLRAAAAEKLAVGETSLAEIERVMGRWDAA